MSRRRDVRPWLLALSVLAVFGAAIGNDFVGLDDNMMIYQNPLIPVRSLTGFWLR